MSLAPQILPMLPSDRTTMQRLVGKLRPNDVIQFSFVSNAGRERVKSLGLKSKSLVWEFDGDRCRIRLVFDDIQQVHFNVWSTWDEPEEAGFEPEWNASRRQIEPQASEVRNLIVGGAAVAMTLARIDRQRIGIREWYVVEKAEEDRMRLIERLSRHLLELFSPNSFSLEAFHVHSRALFDSFLWDITREFAVLSFRPPPEEPVSVEHLRFLLEDVTTSDLLSLEASRSQVKDVNYRHKTPLKGNFVCVVHGPWLTIESLLKMDCRHLLIIEGKTDSPPEEEQLDLTPVLKSWVDGHLPRLQRLQVRGKRVIVDADQLEVLKDHLEIPEHIQRDPALMAFILENQAVRFKNVNGKTGEFELNPDDVVFDFHCSPNFDLSV